MRIDVAFIPQLVSPEAAASSVCVVIDVLRATTTLTTLLACGAALVAVAADATAARAAKARRSGRRSCWAKSVACVRRISTSATRRARSVRRSSPDAGRSATRRMVPRNPRGRHRAGCHARLPAEQRRRRQGGARSRRTQVDRAILIVCSGGAGGRASRWTIRSPPGKSSPRSPRRPPYAGVCRLELSDAAIASETLRQCARIDGVEEPAHTRWEQVLRRTSAGQHLAQIGLGDDIPFCAEIDRETTVPLVRPSEGAVLVGAAIPLLAASRA